MNHINKELTLIIKTFERPKSLKRLLKSINKFYKNIKVIIIDDSKNKLNEKKLTSIHKNINYNYIGFNKGVSYGRNKGIELSNTKYVMILDDDMVFTKNTNLYKLYEIIDKYKFDIVGIDLIDYGLFRRKFEGIYTKRENKIYALFGVEYKKEDNFKLYDFVHNSFISTKEFLIKNRWDDNFKTYPEHDDFFINIKNKNKKITKVNNVSINHFPEYKKIYIKYRFNNKENDLKKFLKKHKIKEFITVNKNKTINQYKNRISEKIFEYIRDIFYTK